MSNKELLQYYIKLGNYAYDILNIILDNKIIRSDVKNKKIDEVIDKIKKHFKYNNSALIKRSCIADGDILTNVNHLHNAKINTYNDIILNILSIIPNSDDMMRLYVNNDLTYAIYKNKIKYRTIKKILSIKRSIMKIT